MYLVLVDAMDWSLITKDILTLWTINDVTENDWLKRAWWVCGSVGYFNWKDPQKLWNEIWGVYLFSRNVPTKAAAKTSGSSFVTSLLVHSVCVSKIEYLTPWHCQYPKCGVAIALNLSKQIIWEEELISFCYQKSHDVEIR